ncbi:uncharacterized protein LOC133533659 isoform X3 [Cydia pomonella]|uniref:uncharacterized protein LOC133533659 isoform X3 n=1 Tax=Cydia pomonella TaxID=82600 RepID=UPI002ADE4F5F|nr:uncharacterized protein LOC133533659 isoform X3 [Cydia pomonella]XP_061729020.1 uncharacterized protein LOC133533659 isoform X3 [Cydia pomonella]XP_061729077.1 uncharacterized protein LOC133533659 isoform X3 [Cydia pomonella]XP_061729125.1 uncharacterized protein LOC133533659 isoform X3 [Cydia pomonella]
MHISQDGPTLSRSIYCASLSAPKSKHLVNDNSIQFNNCWNQFNQTKRYRKNAKSVLVPHFSSSTLSLCSNQNKICKPNIATESTYCDRENCIHGYKRPCIKNIGSYKCQRKECMCIKDFQLYYVFDKPFYRQKETPIAQESVYKCTALCQVDPLKGLKDENKALKQLVNLFTESVECKCIANKLKHLIPHSYEPTPQCACAEAETRAVQCKCKCVANKLKRFIPHSNELKPQCACAEAETQGRNKYGGRVQRAGRESFYRDRGISAVCKCPKAESAEREFFTTIISGFNEPQENIAQTGQKCVKSSTRCQADSMKNEQESLKRLFLRLIKAPTTSVTCVEAKTQSPCYEGSYQRAGRESFCREIGTSGTPNQKMYSEIEENPTEEVNYEPNEDAFYDNYKPVTVDRRIGCNGRQITKCSKDVPQCTRKLAQTSTNCHLDDKNKEKSVFTVFCNMMLQPTNLFPVSKKCCKNRGTICQVDDNEGGVIKKFCELIEPKNITHTASPGRKSRGALCNVDGDRDEDSAIKKLYQVLLDPKGYKNKVKSRIIGAEVTTQSRSYGGRQQRAGREIFCKNRGTSGAPKIRHPNVEKEEYEEIIEELPTCLEIQPDTNREVGIGTNCKISLGWYKDRHAYGEPKPQCDLQGAIEQWNEVPLRQTGTKIGASLKADSRFNFYNTNAATQSRRCRSRHLRAGRETFYKDAQTSCVSKNNKNKVEGNYNAFNQPVQCPASDRKAIRFGSDCSFSFEISKDRNTESPDKLKPCGDKIDGNQNKNPFYSKLIGQWRSSQGNEQKAGKPDKRDTCTCTDVCDDECQCQNLPKASERRPLHIGSKVSYDFNFSKSISPPKATSLVAQEPCIKSSRQERTTKCDAAISAECVPDSNNYDSLNTSSRVTKRVDFPNPILTKLDNNKTAKECFLELVSKKNFLRLIKGDQSPEREKLKEKEVSGSLKMPKIEIPQIVCPAKCNRKCEPVEKPDQPFRVESSFSFDYNMRNVKPKHDKITYEESFPRIEEFSGSVTKLNLFRLIIGKVRKRIKPLVTTACDPVECRLRKERHSSWFTYILDSIKQARQISQIKKEDEESKNFFSDLLLKPSSCLNEFDNNLRKLRRDSRYLYLMSNLREQLKETVRPPVKKSTNSFISQMLARSNDHSRRRRRRRRGRGKIIPKWYEEDIDTLSSSILPSSQKSRTSDEDCKPCQIASDCCFNCDYKKLNNSDISDNETQSSKSTINTEKYATT